MRKTWGGRRVERLLPAGLAILLILLVAVRLEAQGQAPVKPPKTERPKVASVRFIGNKAFKSSHLGRLLLTQKWRFWAPTRYFPEVFQQDLETLRLFYEQQGYLDARIVNTQVKENPQSNTVNIVIELSEGSLTRVGEITISGNRALGEGELLGKMRTRVGAPFQPPQVREDILDLMRLYAEYGYLEADVRPDIRIDSSQRLAAIRFTVEEKNRFRIGRIRLEGYEKTRPRVIQREITFQPGEIVRYSRLVETQQLLFRTGLFQSVFVTPVPPASGEPDLKDILVEVKESQSTEINASVGYSSVGKLGANAELKSSNIAGLALRAGLDGGIDFQKWGVGASFTEPRLFGTRIRTDLNLRFEQLKEPGYDLTHIVSDLQLSRLLGARSQASLGYKYERAAISRARIEPLPTDLDSDLHSLVLAYALDTRNDLLNPTRGFYADWRNELGQDLPLADPASVRFNPYLRSTGSARGYFPLSPSTVLASALSAGWLTHLATEEVFPLNQRFYTGGPNTLRGYDYQQVGPQDINGTPLGGSLMVVWNVFELRQVLFRILSAAIFLDAGGVWPRLQDFSLSDVRIGFGAGLRLNTPIGVVRLDGALKAERREGESPGAVYLSVGQTF